MALRLERDWRCPPRIGLERAGKPRTCSKPKLPPPNGVVAVYLLEVLWQSLQGPLPILLCAVLSFDHANGTLWIGLLSLLLLRPNKLSRTPWLVATPVFASRKWQAIVPYCVIHQPKTHEAILTQSRANPLPHAITVPDSGCSYSSTLGFWSNLRTISWE